MEIQLALAVIAVALIWCAMSLGKIADRLGFIGRELAKLRTDKQP